MSQLDIFGGQGPSNYCLPATLGTSGQFLTSAAPPESGPNILQWASASGGGGQTAQVLGGTLELAPNVETGIGGIVGTYDLYTNGHVVTVVISNFTGSTIFNNPTGALVTTGGVFAPYGPAVTSSGSIAGSGSVTAGTTSVMGYTVDSAGDFTVYPMMVAGSDPYTIELAPCVMIWDSAAA